MKWLRGLRDRLILVSLAGLVTAVAWAFSDLEEYRPASEDLPDLVPQILLLVGSLVVISACSVWQFLDSK